MDLHFLLFFSSVYLCSGIDTNGLLLKQVLILSRHNIRTPLGLHLSTYTPKKLPKNHDKPGCLTRKGALLEGYMGDYFSEWFKSEQLFPEKCPSKDAVHVYANSVHRTIETAKAFVDSAFTGCNVTVDHKITNNTEEMDSNFEPVVHNNTEAFKTMVFKEINRKIKHQKLKTGLTALNKILDFNNSEICQTQSICDLTDMNKNNVFFEVNRELWIYGPLYIAATVMDYFTMSYYGGLPIEDAEWRHVSTPNEWETITEVMRQDQYIRYDTIAEDIGAKLLQLLTSTFLEYDNMPKFMLIVGHDFNQLSIAKIMGFKAIRLPNQFENFPIGGKIVFQRWTDNKNDYLKIEHVYGSWSQLRNGIKFSREDPPQRVLRELEWCKVDKNGFCPWSEFINKLRHRR